MQLTQIDAQTYVGPQISIANLDDLKQLRIKTVIVARPEAETSDQPAISAVRDAAEALGMTVHQIPVVPGNISDDDVRAFSAIASASDGPVFAYCRSGMRAATLWALSAAEQGMAPNDILQKTQDAGFDLSAIAERLAASAS